jgi:hypothetical protein
VRIANGGMRVSLARPADPGSKVSPSVRIKAKTTFTMADVAGQGAIQHIWMTPTGPWRYLNLRLYSLYRWHIMDPVRFESDLRVTIQALGWRADGRYQLLRDDIASVAYWYQAEPHAPFRALPPRDVLELK